MRNSWLAPLFIVLLSCVVAILAPAAILLAAPVQADVAIIDLGTLGGSFSSAVAAAPSGQVVGDSDTVDGFQAFSWTVKSGMTALSLGGFSLIIAVNVSGRVIGNSGNADNGLFVGFAWTESEGIVPLTLGGNSQAMAVNERG